MAQRSVQQGRVLGTREQERRGTACTTVRSTTVHSDTRLRKEETAGARLHSVHTRRKAQAGAVKNTPHLCVFLPLRPRRALGRQGRSCAGARRRRRRRFAFSRRLCGAARSSVFTQSKQRLLHGVLTTAAHKEVGEVSSVCIGKVSWRALLQCTAKRCWVVCCCHRIASATALCGPWQGRRKVTQSWM